jgi:hypothetical protein
MITAYLVFCAVIFDYYKKVEGEGNGEKFTTLLVTSILLFFNFGSIYLLFNYFTTSNFIINKFLVIAIMLSIGFLNYLLFIRRKELYEDIVITKKHKNFVLIYFAISLALTLIVLKLHHDRNVEFLMTK